MLELLNFNNARRLPVILQTEATECGLACLSMIAKFYGHDVDLNGMRALHPTSLKGTSLDTLVDLSGNMDLGSRALRLDLESMKHLQLPAILHWDLNHFVVLKSIKNDVITIHDPARGERKLSFKEASDSFTGVALELLPTSTFKKQVARQKMTLSSLWSRLIGLKRAIFQTLILSIILQIIVLASPFYLQLVIDEAAVKFDLKLLLVLALGFGMLSVVNSVTTMMRSLVILYFGHQMSFQMAANVFRHLIHLPADYFEKRHVGDIISRIGSTGPIQTALTQSVVAAIIDGLMAAVTGIVIFLYSPLLGMIVLLSVALLLIVTLAYYPILRQRQEEVIITEARKESHVIESIRASTTIKLFSAQNQRTSAWRNLFADTVNANVSYGKYEIFMTTLNGLITGLQTIAVVYLGAKLIIDNQVGFTVGMLFAFMSYRGSFTDSATSLMAKVIEFRLLNLHLDRIADITKSETEEGHDELATIENNSSSATKIELLNVSFRYSEADPWVLKAVNLTIETGEFIVFTGRSGHGKTTLLKLISGLYMPTEGQILINGRPLTRATRIGWRKNLGVVLQDDQLLTGSLADNISFFDPDMDMSRVREAAKMAYIHQEIMTMPMNYLSLVGDMGAALSGGQRQRLLLARALYRNPPVILLDEGTANIDSQTEKLIVDALSKSTMTRLVVAHRQQFIAQAGRIVTLVNGRIAQ